MGKEYISDHCVSSFYEKTRKSQVESYICDSLMNINSILANRFGGPYIPNRLPDYFKFKPKKEKQSPQMTEEEIKERIKHKVNSFAKGGVENEHTDTGSETDS